MRIKDGQALLVQLLGNATVAMMVHLDSVQQQCAVHVVVEQPCLLSPLL
jgi:hypothetical protein